MGKTRWTAVRHAIQPRLRYRNIPLEDQHDNPYYDSNDRVRPRNELTYSVSNILTRKRERVVAKKPAKEGEKPTPVIATDYLDFLRVTLEQSYDFREATRTDERDTFERRPFQDVISEVEVRFDEFISLSSRSYWSPYLDKFVRHDHGVTFQYSPWGSIYTGLGYRAKVDEYLRERKEDVKILTLRGDLNLYGPFAIGFSLSHDYERSENVDRELRVIYNHQCFQLMGVFSKDAYEEHYGMRIVLTGLGD